jgi:lipoprotein signal peptidase
VISFFRKLAPGTASALALGCIRRAVGNLIDRLTRGEVSTSFTSASGAATLARFQLADSFIVIGVGPCCSNCSPPRASRAAQDGAGSA